MSLRLKLPLHGRSHLQNGSDPIPGLGDFIRYILYPQTGEWLYIATSGDRGGVGIALTASAIVEILSAGGHWDASTDGGTLQFDADGIALNSLNGVDLTATAVDGGSVQLISTDNDVELNADKTVLIEGDATPGTSEVIRVTLGGKTWEFRSNGDVHIPTGASVIADT